MSLKAEIKTWADALAAYDEQNYEAALSHFQSIADSSKIMTNIGLIHAVIGEHESAVENFNLAVQLDRYLAIAYFQCGVSNFLLGQFEMALNDFNYAIDNLRGNDCIKYQQLGLDFTLYAAEIIFNRGLSQINMGLMDEGLEDLRGALRLKVTPEHSVIDECLRVQGEGFTVFSIPIGVLFRPSQSKVKNINSRDYLGKAILVAADDKRNAYTGFTGVELMRRGEMPSGARMDVTPVDERPPGVALVDAPLTRSRSNEEWVPSKPLNRSASAGTPSISRSASIAGPLRRNNSAGNPSAPPSIVNGSAGPSRGFPRSPPPPMPLGRSMSERVPLRAPMPAHAPEPALAQIYDNYIDEPTPQHTAAGRTPLPSSTYGVGIARTPSRAASVARRPTQQYRQNTNNMPLSRFTATTFEQDNDYAASAVTVSFGKIRVKLHFKDEVRGMAIAPDMPFAEFSDKVRSKFNTPQTPGMKFADEDGAKVSLMDEMDFELAIETAVKTAKPNAEGRLEVWCAA